MTDVTVVSTADDGSCGIGTYTGELLRTLPEGTGVIWITIPLRSANPLPYMRAAISAGLSDGKTVHVQHEYGIYGPKSLWSWIFFPILFMLSSLRRKRVITTFHSAWNDETIGPPLVPLKRLYVAANNRMLVAATDHAIFLSENAAEDFKRSATPGSMEVLPHGVQGETRDISKSKAKATFDAEEDDTLVMEPGYIRQEKGCDAFVDIAQAFDGDADFILAGGCQNDEAYCGSLRRKAPPNLRITGTLDDDRFHAAFVAADLIVLPYREVTQSGIFNWCAAYEVPVVGSDTQYFRGIADRWSCVDIVDTEDATAAATRVSELLEDDDRQSTLSAGMREYRTASSLSSVAERHAELYASDEISTDETATSPPRTA